MIWKRRFDKRVERIMAEMEKSRDGKRICDWIRKNIHDIKYDTQAGMLGYYLSGTGHLFINPNLSDDLLAVVIAHEARHAWQDQNGLMDGVTHMPHDTYVFTMRLIEADAHREMVMFAYNHAKDTDDQRYLEALVDGNSFTYFIGKAARLHARYGKSGDDAVIQRGLFDAFFEARNPAFSIYNKRLSEDVAKRPNGWVAHESVSLQKLRKLGEVPGTKVNYLDVLYDGKAYPLDSPAYTKGLRALKILDPDWLKPKVQKRPVSPRRPVSRPRKRFWF